MKAMGHGHVVKAMGYGHIVEAMLKGTCGALDAECLLPEC